MRVSVIMPTANRPEMLEKAILGFLAQDWEDKELIVVGSHFGNSPLAENIQYHLNVMHDPSIGAKRNRACGIARGEIICHFDTDDVYAPDWITKSVNALIQSAASMTGLSSAYFYQQDPEKFYKYNYRGSQPYVVGASMCYHRRVWGKNKFKDISEGEDAQFCAMAGNIVPHNYIEGFCAILHGANTASHKQIWQFKELPLSEKEKVFSNLLR